LIARSIANRASMPPLDRLDGDPRLPDAVRDVWRRDQESRKKTAAGDSGVLAQRQS